MVSLSERGRKNYQTPWTDLILPLDGISVVKEGERSGVLSPEQVSDPD
jgi:hypothetical protein